MKRLVEFLDKDVQALSESIPSEAKQENFEMPYSEGATEVLNIEEGITEFVRQRDLKMHSVYVSVFNPNSFVLLTK